ncbi:MULTISPECIES: hypothetical protein [Acidiphilium]|uniref:hypothetical protein n=1 Tax=Acidiphilium TaxID=522 RepID=UPI0011157CF7|nr:MULTISPECIES: hypothetical protein [Acidiphilium]MCW8308735.1 hypothetical protein [Acidiphilium sp. PA]
MPPLLAALPDWLYDGSVCPGPGAGRDISPSVEAGLGDPIMLEQAPKPRTSKETPASFAEWNRTSPFWRNLVCIVSSPRVVAKIRFGIQLSNEQPIPPNDSWYCSLYFPGRQDKIAVSVLVLAGTNVQVIMCIFFTSIFMICIDG